MNEQEVRAEFYSGPLPDAEYLERCEALCPGFTTRVVAQWEDQSRHRQALERVAVSAEVSAQSRGQVYGLAVALAGFGVCAYAVAVHEPTVAGVIAALDITGLVTVFVLGRRRTE